MVRVFLTIVLPLGLPTALYLLWTTTIGGSQEGDAVAWASVPWIWLVGAGAVLLAIVLSVITVGFGTRQEGVYVAPRYVNGHIVPGHIEPHPPR
jgi:hypothetical protein